MITEITEDQAYQLAEYGTVFPVLQKTEDEATQSAVTLKQFPTGYILGVSCDTKNIFRLFFSEDFEELNLLCGRYTAVLHRSGNPFAEEV